MDSQFGTLRVEAAVRPESAASVGVRNALAFIHFSARTSRPAVVISAFLLLWIIPPGAFARARQQSGGRDSGSRALPDAPVPAFIMPISTRPAPPAGVGSGAASVEGVVLDASGATSFRARQLSLRHEDGGESQLIASGTNGEFSFTKIPAGSYLVSVDANGFAPYTSEEFALQGQQDYEVPDFVLSVAGASTEMIVHPTEFIAAEQMRAAEKQRLMGVIPELLHELYVRHRAAEHEAEIPVCGARDVRSRGDGGRRLRRGDRAGYEFLCGIRTRRLGLCEEICGEICRWTQQRLLHARHLPIAPASGSALLLSGHWLGEVARAARDRLGVFHVARRRVGRRQPTPQESKSKRGSIRLPSI